MHLNNGSMNVSLLKNGLHRRCFHGNLTKLFGMKMLRNCFVCFSFSGSVIYCRISLPEKFYKKVVLKNFTKFTGKQLCQILFFLISRTTEACNFIIKRLQHKYFPVSFAKYVFKNTFFIEHLWWLFPLLILFMVL